MIASRFMVSSNPDYTSALLGGWVNKKAKLEGKDGEGCDLFFRGKRE